MNKVKTPQWEAQTSNLWKQDCINISNNNHYAFLSCLVSFFSCPLFVAIPSPTPPPPTPFYRPSPSLIPPTGLPLVGSFWDIFPSSIGFPSILIIKQDFWGVFVLFRLSYMYLMWQRLSGEPLTNVEEAVSVILILLGSFPRCT